MGGLFSKPKPSVVEPPEKINIAGPTGSTTFGDYVTDPVTGEQTFVPQAGITTQLTQESPFQEQFRTGQENLSLGLLSQLTPGLTGLRSISDIESALSPVGASASEIGAASGELGNFITPREVRGNLPGAPSIASVGRNLTPLSQDFSSDAASLEEATFQRVQNRLAPGFSDEKERLVQNLADRGIDPDSPAAARAMARLSERQNNALTDAALGAVSAGRAEQERLARLGLDTRSQQFGEQATTFDLARALRGQEYGQEMGLAGLASAIRGQQFGEQRANIADQLMLSNFAEQQRQARLQEQLALAGLEQQQRGQQFGEIGALTQFTSPFTPTPITSLAGGQTGATPGGAGPQIIGGMLGGLAANPAMFAALSDRALKKNIDHVGEHSGYNVYEFEYIDSVGIDGRYRGVMADEVEAIAPDAVLTVNGFKAVNYNMIPVNMERIA